MRRIRQGFGIAACAVILVLGVAGTAAAERGVSERGRASAAVADRFAGWVDWFFSRVVAPSGSPAPDPGDTPDSRPPEGTPPDVPGGPIIEPVLKPPTGPG